MFGKLTVIVGPMFSGKTTHLLSMVEVYQRGKRPFVLFKHGIDDRYAATEVVSHKEVGHPAIVVNNSKQLLEYVRELEVPVKAVFVDEVQFFEEALYNRAIFPLLKIGLNVFCSGLDLSFRNEPFQTVSVLLAHADEIVKCKSVCYDCGEYSGRVSFNIQEKVGQSDIDVGGDEKYIPLCLKCFVDRKQL
jgi:thymidine kinase